MAVAFVAAGSVSYTVGTTLSPSSPAGSSGDLVLFFLTHDDYSDGELTPSTPPITLTKIHGGDPQLGDDTRQCIYWGIEDQAGGRAFTFGTLGASEEISGICLRYSGHHATVQPEAGSLKRDGGWFVLGTDADYPGSMFISFTARDSAVPAGSSAPSDWTERGTGNSTGAVFRVCEQLAGVNYPFPRQIPELGYGIDAGAAGQPGAVAYSFVINPIVTSYTLAGVTKDKDGNTLATCEVALFREIGGSPPAYQYVASTTSDGSGDYSFTVYENPAQFMVYSIKDNTPHVFDATDNVLQPS